MIFDASFFTCISVPVSDYIRCRKYFEESHYEQCVSWTLESATPLFKRASEWELRERRKWRTMSLPKPANHQQRGGWVVRNRGSTRICQPRSYLSMIWHLASDIPSSDCLKGYVNQPCTDIWIESIPTEPYGIVCPLRLFFIIAHFVRFCKSSVCCNSPI